LESDILEVNLYELTNNNMRAFENASPNNEEQSRDFNSSPNFDPHEKSTGELIIRQHTGYTLAPVDEREQENFYSSKGLKKDNSIQQIKKASMKNDGSSEIKKRKNNYSTFNFGYLGDE